MLRPLYILVFIVFGFLCSHAQEEIRVFAIVEGNDTTPFIRLDEVVVMSKRKFKSKKHERRWNRLYRDVVKVYPYAKQAGVVLKDIDKELAQIEDRKPRKTFMKKKERALRDEFEKELINLTIRQGVILIKLIDRETGNTCFYLIKEMKGSLQAFFWQSIARIFGHNLKFVYDADTERDIEAIVRSIENR